MKRIGLCCVLACVLRSTASAASLEDALASAGDLTKKARETLGARQDPPSRGGQEAPPQPPAEPVANIAYDGWTVTLGLGQTLALQVTPAEGFSSVYPSFDENLLHVRYRLREGYTVMVYRLLAVKPGETEISVLACNPGPDNYLGAEKTVFKVKVRILADPDAAASAEPPKKP